jgi:hypothetical protein
MKFQMLFRSLGLIVVASLNMAMGFAPAAVPPTSVLLERSAATIPTLGDFVAIIKNGQAGQVVGVYVPDVLALKVAQQPVNSPTFVNGNIGYVTQFSLPTQYGTTGLLAHNYLSGALFFDLSIGQEVDIIYGDGYIHLYTISTVRHFRAVSPTNPDSKFVEIDDNRGTEISSTDLFHQIYAKGDQVVFQTCINANNNVSWGRLFVIATPTSLRYDPVQNLKHIK